MPFDIGHLKAPYDEASQATDFSFDDGIRVFPVQGPPGTAPKKVRVHAGIGRKQLSFAFQRTGAVPLLPDPTPQNSNETLLAGNIKTMPPALMADQSLICRVEGQFVYALARPLTHKDTLPLGSGPQDSTPGTQYAVLPEDWSTHWIGIQTPAPVPLDYNFIAAS